jgi:mannosyltransferase OCH1-like enzyme
MVPKTYFSVSKTNEQSFEQIGITLSNPEYKRNHYGDDEAYEFVKEHCGDDAGDAYSCLAPPAYRADLFRFCALYTHGGLYMDSDIVPLVPLDELYDPCATATVGHDWPQGRPQKQMKILAGQAGSPIFLCMLHKIINNVRTRSYPDNPLALTGPMALHECYDEHSDDVSITYHDTRDASYPYSGMRAGDKLLAFEVPNHEGHNYKIDFNLHEVYRPTCPLHKEVVKPAKVASA